VILLLIAKRWGVVKSIATCLKEIKTKRFKLPAAFLFIFQQMQQQMERCAECFLSNLQHMADTDETFDFREYV
jgi:hypothetical protein